MACAKRLIRGTRLYPSENTRIKHSGRRFLSEPAARIVMRSNGYFRRRIDRAPPTAVMPARAIKLSRPAAGTPAPALRFATRV